MVETRPIRVIKGMFLSRTSVSSFISSSKVWNAFSKCKQTVFTRLQATACLFCNVKRFWAYPAAWLDKLDRSAGTYTSIRNMTNLWNCVRDPRKLSRNNGSNSSRKFARSLKFEVWEIISLKIGLVSSVMEHDTGELFCCLARDCNYRDEKLCDVNFKSGLSCTRQNIVFKALGCFRSFLKLYMYIQIEAFMYAITSHKKQRAKYQTEMLSRIT